MAVCAGNVVVTEGLDRILSLVEIYIEHQNVKVSLHEHLPMPLDGVDLPSLGPGSGPGCLASTQTRLGRAEVYMNGRAERIQLE